VEYEDRYYSVAEGAYGELHRHALEVIYQLFHLTVTKVGVKPRKKVRILRDDPDNRVLECAFAGDAEIIVTGDQMMLKLGVCEGVRVVALREFLELVEG
jgi:predicted nucleic acid-binding protein